MWAPRLDTLPVFTVLNIVTAVVNTPGVLALVFAALGALVQHGANQEIALASAAFAQQLVAMYTATIGD